MAEIRPGLKKIREVKNSGDSANQRANPARLCQNPVAIC